MKKALQLSALLFAAIFAVATSPAFVPAAHANAAILSAPTAHSATNSAQATDPTPQSQPATQPQDQNPPNAQNPQPNGQNPNPGAPPLQAQGRHLPKTASPLPELVLIGFLSLLGIVVVRRLASNSI